MSRVLYILALVHSLLGMGYSEAQERPASFDQLRITTEQSVRKELEPQLRRYCGPACEIIRIDAKIKEQVSDLTDLGFESIARESDRPQFYADKIVVEIQVDDRVTRANRDRLQTILRNYLAGHALSNEILWRSVLLPNIGTGSSSADLLKQRLEERLARAMNTTIQTYCPNTCLLASIDIRGELISLDEANQLPRRRLIWDDAARTSMRIDQIDIQVTMDEDIDVEEQSKILNVMRARTAFAEPLDISSISVAFPPTYAERQALEEENDPYGLEKLRQMLQIFRDLAGTKEIITNNSSNSSRETETSSSTESELSEINKSKSLSSDSQRTAEDAGVIEDWMLWAMLGLMALVVVFGVVRYLAAQRDSKVMMAGAQSGATSPMMLDENGQPVPGTGVGAQAGPNVVAASKLSREELALKFKIDALKEELTDMFIHTPQVAKATFTRMLKEDGVEETAKYLHIFGHMIVMELIEDPNLTRDIYALSEFFHKSSFDFDLETEHKLLVDLKTKSTASEIRVLSRRGSDKFKFLERLDPAQIYTLISEEKTKVQGIVLTQLDKKKRLAVYDMYQGRAKVSLMNELCRADAIPKEFLYNVAKALERKVRSRPEFDTENLRSSDIIVDLLERSALPEQRSIMDSLRKTNADTARGIMMKLVTIEILPYLKDGHLLELILGMEREDLVVFLAATPDHVQRLMLSKAPAELAESWVEDLEAMGSVEEKVYRLVELKIFNRIRSLADSGAINILDINEMIFAPGTAAQTQETVGTLSSDSQVA